MRPEFAATAFILCLTCLIPSATVAQGTGQAPAKAETKPAEKPLSPRDTLAQYLADLQKNPDDKDLREKIIRLAVSLEPVPEIPREVNGLFVKGTTFQKAAKSESDYELAIGAYREALLLAPWLGAAYYNLSLAQEGAKKFDDAIQSLKLYLLSGPKKADADEAENHIFALEAYKELEAKARQEKASTAAAEEAKIGRFVGHWEWTSGNVGKQDPKDALCFYRSPDGSLMVRHLCESCSITLCSPGRVSIHGDHITFEVPFFRSEVLFGWELTMSADESRMDGVNFNPQRRDYGTDAVILRRTQ